ncbi:hypothetical protein VTN02DRAFT_6368 [Thermoascus thermophilus]
MLACPRICLRVTTSRGASITLSITLTLLFRPLGAALVGITSDLFGRKWPMIVNLGVLAILQVGTAFARTYAAFVAVRALFGVAMGGIWGLAAAIALENMPADARGLFSGILQQGYSVGYLLAAVVNIAVVPHSAEGFKAVFHVGAGFSALVAIVQMFLPESKIFRRSDTGGEDGHEQRRSLSRRIALFARDLGLVGRQYWRMFLYCVLLATAFNWMSHGAQDMYSTYMKLSKGFSNSEASLATIIGQIGAVTGGTICGSYSQFLGRRLTVVATVCFGLAVIPLWTLPSTWGPLAAGNFLVQSAVNGAWGVMPVLLNEYSPPQFRGVFPGTVYQVGNMLSAPAAEIQTVAASAWVDAHGRPKYGQVMTITVCVVFAAVGVITACGQERLGSHFEVVKRAGAEENLAREMVERALKMKEDAVAGAQHVEEVVLEDGKGVK